MQIVKHFLPDTQYFKQEIVKTQITLHHTASSHNAKNVIDGWNADSRRVGTAYVIDGKGIIYEAFEPKYWASAIAYFIKDADGNPVNGNDKAYELLPNTANRATNLAIETRNIQIELTNWGYVTLGKNGVFYNYVNGIVAPNEVEELPTPFRGFKYYHKYTNPQLSVMAEIIKELGKNFQIPLKFSQNYEFDKNAVNGVPGIWQHSNFRHDKSDLNPQKELIRVMKQFA